MSAPTQPVAPPSTLRLPKTLPVGWEGGWDYLTKDGKPSRPPMLPGSFQILVLGLAQ